MSEITTDAGGQTNTGAVTQGSDAAAAGAGADASLLGGADAGAGKAAEGAAPGGETLLGGDKQGDGTAPKDGEKPADGENADGKKDGADEPPAEYEDFVAPEGVKMDTEVMGEFKALAKEHKLTQDQAQKLADMGVKLVQKTQAQHTAQVQAEIAKWATDSRADAEFGGDKLTENLAGANTALEKFGSDSLKTMLKETGLGNHPEVIRLLHRVNKATSEDAVIRGEATKQDKPLAQKLYPNMNP